VNFRQVDDCSLWTVFLIITNVAKFVWQLFPTIMAMHLCILEKMGGVTFWTIFSQFYLVTLLLEMSMPLTM
jgi:hypothetical protein